MSCWRPTLCVPTIAQLLECEQLTVPEVLLSCELRELRWGEQSVSSRDLQLRGAHVALLGGLQGHARLGSLSWVDNTGQLPCVLTGGLGLSPSALGSVVWATEYSLHRQA